MTMLRFGGAVLAAALTIGTASLSATADSPSATAPTSFVEAGGTRYAYRQFGADTGTPLIMLIRYRANMDDWDPAFLDTLARERPVIVFNQAGVASSTGDVPQTIGGMAADVAQFVTGMGLDEVDVLGWSMGGLTAQAFAIDHPELTRRIILVGTGPAASAVTPPPSDQSVFAVATKDARQDGLTTYSNADRGSLFFADTPQSQAAAASFARIDAARRADEPVSTDDVRTAQTAVIEEFWFNAENGYFDGLSGIAAPALIVNGDSDVFFTVTASAILYDQIPDAQVAIFPATGHGPQHQHPEAIGSMINAFLQ